MNGMKDNPMQKLRIKRGEGGWEIVSGPDPLEIKVGTFLTFQEAYDIYNRMRGSDGHRERTTKECEGTTGTVEQISQEDQDSTGGDPLPTKANKTRRKFPKWYVWLGLNGRSNRKKVT